MAVVIALDAGTTGVRAMAVGRTARPVGARYREFPQYFPRPGWVEHDPEEIWAAVAAHPGRRCWRRSTSRWPPSASPTSARRVVLWDRRTGRPLHRAIVWQDRRGAPLCRTLEAAGHLELVRARTGLVLDPYFSATKLAWLLDEGGVEAGPDLAFGTVDSWLLWRLTGGARPRHRSHQCLPHPALRHPADWRGTRSWPICSACRCRSCPRWGRRAAGWGPRPPGWCRDCPPGCRSAGWPATSRRPSSARPASGPA